MDIHLENINYHVNIQQLWLSIDYAGSIFTLT